MICAAAVEIGDAKKLDQIHYLYDQGQVTDPMDVNRNGSIH